MSPRWNPKAVVGSLAKGFAPDFLSGVLEEEAKGKSVAEFYESVDKGIWNSLPPGQRQFLLNQKPWDLSWLNLSFIISSIATSNRKIACLIISSPELQEKIQEEIEKIKQILS